MSESVRGERLKNLKGPSQALIGKWLWKPTCVAATVKISWPASPCSSDSRLIEYRRSWSLQRVDTAVPCCMFQPINTTWIPDHLKLLCGSQAQTGRNFVCHTRSAVGAHAHVQYAHTVHAVSAVQYATGQEHVQELPVSRLCDQGSCFYPAVSNIKAVLSNPSSLSTHYFIIPPFCSLHQPLILHHPSSSVRGEDSGELHIGREWGGERGAERKESLF